MSPRGRTSAHTSSTSSSSSTLATPERTSERPSIVLPDRAAESDSDAVSLHSSASVSLPPLLWVHTTIGDLVNIEKLVTVDHKISVEIAFERMSQKRLTCLPLTRHGKVFDFFDYADLTGYLLLVLGDITVKGEHSKTFEERIVRARQGIPASVGFAAQFGGGHDPFVHMPANTSLTAAFEQFASGVHRIAVTSAHSSDVIGILSQRRMVRYVWNNLRRFPGLEQALELTLGEQKIGTYDDVVCISGDAPVIDALDTMHALAVSSIAVVDASRNLLGNISVTDVSLLTRAWQAGLLRQSCKHFLTVILDHRGIEYGGNESVPVFYVYRNTKLSKVIATMIATMAHRLWICEHTADPAQSGKLIGVISLTDVLNFVARHSGNNQTLDPEATRRHRRSSSSSVRSSSSAVRHIIHDGSPLERPKISFERPRRQQ